MAARVDRSGFETEVLGADGLVIADFYSDSCIPCKRMSPLLSELEAERSGSLKVVKVNAVFDGELAEEYEVASVPALIFFLGGKEVHRLVGAVSRDTLFEAADKLLSLEKESLL